MKIILGLMIVGLLCSGCDNAVINPDIAKARSGQRQEVIELDKLKALNRIADALEAR